MPFKYFCSPCIVGKPDAVEDASIPVAQRPEETKPAPPPRPSDIEFVEQMPPGRVKELPATSVLAMPAYLFAPTDASELRLALQPREAITALRPTKMAADVAASAMAAFRATNSNGSNGNAKISRASARGAPPTTSPVIPVHSPNPLGAGFSRSSAPTGGGGGGNANPLVQLDASPGTPPEYSPQEGRSPTDKALNGTLAPAAMSTEHATSLPAAAEEATGPAASLTGPPDANASQGSIAGANASLTNPSFGSPRARAVPDPVGFEAQFPGFSAECAFQVAALAYGVYAPQVELRLMVHPLPKQNSWSRWFSGGKPQQGAEASAADAVPASPAAEATSPVAIDAAEKKPAAATSATRGRWAFWGGAAKAAAAAEASKEGPATAPTSGNAEKENDKENATDATKPAAASRWAFWRRAVKAAPAVSDEKDAEAAPENAENNNEKAAADSEAPPLPVKEAAPLPPNAVTPGANSGTVSPANEVTSTSAASPVVQKGETEVFAPAELQEDTTVPAAASRKRSLGSAASAAPLRSALKSGSSATTPTAAKAGGGLAASASAPAALRRRDSASKSQPPPHTEQQPAATAADTQQELTTLVTAAIRQPPINPALHAEYLASRLALRVEVCEHFSNLDADEKRELELRRAEERREERKAAKARDPAQRHRAATTSGASNGGASAGKRRFGLTFALRGDGGAAGAAKTAGASSSEVRRSVLLMAREGAAAKSSLQWIRRHLEAAHPVIAGVFARLSFEPEPKTRHDKYFPVVGFTERDTLSANKSTNKSSNKNGKAPTEEAATEGDAPAWRADERAGIYALHVHPLHGRAHRTLPPNLVGIGRSRFMCNERPLVPSLQEFAYPLDGCTAVAVTGITPSDRADEQCARVSLQLCRLDDYSVAVEDIPNATAQQRQQSEDFRVKVATPAPLRVTATIFGLQPDSLYCLVRYDEAKLPAEDFLRGEWDACYSFWTGPKNAKFVPTVVLPNVDTIDATRVSIYRCVRVDGASPARR